MNKSSSFLTVLSFLAVLVMPVASVSAAEKAYAYAIQETPVVTKTLKQLQATGLIRRVVHDAYPPVVEYGPAPRARKLAEILRSF